jgi:beta-phosphoglucomutase
MSIKAIIFDFDGIVLNSSIANVESWNFILKNLWLSMNNDIPLKIKWIDRKHSLEIIMQEYNISLTDFEKNDILYQKNKLYLDYILSSENKNILISWVLEFIQKIHNMWLLLWIGSSSKNAKFLIDKLNLTKYFNVIVDGNDLQFTKPNPEVFIKCSNMLNINVENCLVFEDSDVWVSAAKNAWIKVIWVGVDLLDSVDMMIKDFIDIDINTILTKINTYKL